jgi:hypothetical protein
MSMHFKHGGNLATNYPAVECRLSHLQKIKKAADLYQKPIFRSP